MKRENKNKNELIDSLLFSMAEFSLLLLMCVQKTRKWMIARLLIVPTSFYSNAINL